MRRINWIPSIILPVATAIIIAAWVGPLIHWLVRSTGVAADTPTPPTLLIALLLLVGVYQARLALKRDRREVIRQRNASLIIGGLIAIGVAIVLTYRDQFPATFLRGLLDWRDSISPEALIFIGFALVWWRGIAAGRADTLDDESFEKTFYRGVAALAGLLVLNTATHFISSDEMLLSVLTFFTVAVGGLALINIERARVRQNGVGLTWRKVYRSWLTTIFGVVGIILLLGVGITYLVAPNSIGRVWANLQPLFEALGAFITAILTVLFTIAAFLAQPIFPILQWIGQLLTKILIAALTILHDFGVAINVDKFKEGADSFLNSQTFINLSRTASLLLVLAVIAAIAIWWLRRSSRLAKNQSDEIRESIASRQLLWSQLKNLLARWRTYSGSNVPPLYLALDPASTDPHVIIRSAYQSMLNWARGYGYPRFPFQTPLLYADALGRKLPHAKESIDALTQSYLLARYSIDPLLPDEAVRAQAALDQMLTAPPANSTSV
jgi:hypothetical protein